MDSVRLDVWLDVACLFRTRSEAQKAVKGGKVDVNGSGPSRTVSSGLVTDCHQPAARPQTAVVVKALAEKHIAKAEARALYDDVTPPPSPEEIEMLQMARLARPFLRAAGAGSPDKRERRQIRRVKEGRVQRDGHPERGTRLAGSTTSTGV